MQNVRHLRVWHLAQRIARDVIEALPERSSRRIPGLRSQIIRAAISVPANIAEGCGKTSRAEFLRFLEVALGSLNELDSHLQLARDTGMLAAAPYARITRDLNKARSMLISLMRSVQHDLATGDRRTPA